MLADIPFELSQARWELWSIPVAGFICTGLVLVGGQQWLLARRHVPITYSRPSTILIRRRFRQNAGKRRAPRRFKARILIFDKNGSKEPFSGYVIDRSIGPDFAFRSSNHLKKALS